MNPTPTSRRQFLTGSLSCSAYLLGVASFAPQQLNAAFAPQQSDKVVAREKWGRLEKVADGIWALISTPFDSRDFTTVCNGGIVQGDDRVLAVESFMQPAGATWLAQQAEKLTGKWPTDVVSTHYHGDHTSGHPGYWAEGKSPRIWLTQTTRQQAEKSFQGQDPPGKAFQNFNPLNAKSATTIDLGNRQVKLVPRSGHTTSDVTVEVVDPKVVWCGDLFFNRMFPNYGDAIPSRLNQYVQTLVADKQTIFVPGHGPIADQAAIEKYKAFLAFVEKRAKSAFADGDEIEAASKAFELPKDFSDWLVWSPDNAKRAFTAWYRELKGNK